MLPSAASASSSGRKTATITASSATYGSFTRTFSLPRSVDAARSSPNYRDGILEIAIPKLEEAQPKQIQINVKAKPSVEGDQRLIARVRCGFRGPPTGGLFICEVRHLRRCEEPVIGGSSDSIHFSSKQLSSSAYRFLGVARAACSVIRGGDRRSLRRPRRG